MELNTENLVIFEIGEFGQKWLIEKTRKHLAKTADHIMGVIKRHLSKS